MYNEEEDKNKNKEPVLYQGVELKLKYREEVENIKCEDINVDDMAEAVTLGEKMIEFTALKGGVGLAAPQIGIFKNIIVWENNKERIFQIGFNPKYYIDGKKVNTVEGCLSYPDENYYCSRGKYIRAIYFVPNKEKNELFKVTRKLHGQEAIRFQHETDHLDGITIAMIGRKL